MGLWAYLAATTWTYFGLLFRAFGNRFGRIATYERAVACFSRALAHAPQDASLYYYRGTLYWRELSDPKQAEADLTRAIELNPALSRAYLNRGFVRRYALPANPSGAMEDLHAYLDRADDPYWRAVAMEELRQLEEESAQPGGAVSE